ncbi:hypothetical protein QMP26_05335 [Enterocloster clostridioformis]|uniref:hypothetical protein n=1 Tax=Enterocloster clostridioformis TaxID=1531 RepID=UPI0026752DE4|nr:hypothetical protein [Enterocloster clostridioformis]
MRKTRTWIQGHLTVLFNEWSGTPGILRNKVCCLAGLALVIFCIGAYGGVRYHARDFLVLSGCLSLAMLYKLYGILRIVLRGEYYVIEGTVLQTLGRRRAGRFYRATLLLDNGMTEVLLLDKNRYVEEGKRYQFYFRSTHLPGSQSFGAFLDTDSYLGVAEVGDR